jgi:hypothetical protein
MTVSDSLLLKNVRPMGAASMDVLFVDGLIVRIEPREASTNPDIFDQTTPLIETITAITTAGTIVYVSSKDVCSWK